MNAEPASRGDLERSSAWGVFLVFLRLGLTSFGGPVAHLGYFRAEFVERRRWMTEHGYADLVALCQFLPGPASSQVGIGIGYFRAGMKGALAAWTGFTLPSALAMILFALGLQSWGAMPPGVLHGLKLVAVAVVAQALWGMVRALCPRHAHKALMLASASFLLAFPSGWNQLAVLFAGPLIGHRLFADPVRPAPRPALAPIRRGIALGLLAAFALLLAALPLLAGASGNTTLAMIDVFYRTGALVFGGGHVMLPLLQAEVVPPGWIDNDTFLAGYGAAQALPGPLFTFAAFLGASASGPASGWTGGMLALAAIFLPAFLLVLGTLPLWDRLRTNPSARAALSGINAAVVGVLLVAFYDPVCTSAIHGPADVALAALALIALTRLKLPPWLVVIASAALAALLALAAR